MFLHFRKETIFFSKLNTEFISRYIDNPDIGRVGRASIATPGFVAGLKYARDKYGSHEVIFIPDIIDQPGCFVTLLSLGIKRLNNIPHYCSKFPNQIRGFSFEKVNSI